ncbi:hypothetical protein T07_9783 [Trichinella nelsoni]|uniref:Uncharacterized protein n=1 Tax=Trichinella nelsoni TaxID=6336 RepID=A0A0V0S6X3_9BILA|nr:hypothetical protein T07_9783 [Trichinella nelsoni]
MRNIIAFVPCLYSHSLTTSGEGSQNTMAMINGNENAVNLQQSRGSSHKYPTLQNFLLNIKHKDACSQSKKRINSSQNIFKTIKNYYISVQAAAMQARNYQSRQKNSCHIKRYIREF